MKRLLLPLMTTLLLGVGMAWVAPREDPFGANAAYERGDYATALATCRLIAAPGIVKAQESLGTIV
jgi:hypothetical protein